MFSFPSPVVHSALFSLFYAHFTNIPSYLLPLTLSCGFILNPLRMLSFWFLLWPLCCLRTHKVFFFLKYISCFNCFPVAGCWRCLTNGIPLWSKNILCTTRTLQTTCELSEGLRYGLSWLMSGYLRIRVLAMLDSVFYRCRLLQLHCAVQLRKVYTNLEPFLRQYDTEIPSDNHEFLLFEGFCS